MNKDRRKRLATIVDAIDEQMGELEYLRDEEQEAFDNLPESIQYSDRGSEMEDGISEMDDLYNDLEDIRDRIQELCER